MHEGLDLIPDTTQTQRGINYPKSQHLGHRGRRQQVQDHSQSQKEFKSVSGKKGPASKIIFKMKINHSRNYTLILSAIQILI